MISYELAKKLKEAGYPQHPMGRGNSDCVPSACFPTLSELIEGCGDGYLILTKTPDICSVSYGDFVLLGQTILNAIGKTPKEAVANLWLALHTPPSS